MLLRDPENANLLTLLLSRRLGRILGDAGAARPARFPEGELTIVAGAMITRLRLGAEPSLHSGEAPPGGAEAPIRARIEGPLDALLAAVVGSLPIRAVLAGEIRMSGNIRLCWSALRLLRGSAS